MTPCGKYDIKDVQSILDRSAFTRWYADEISDVLMMETF